VKKWKYTLHPRSEATSEVRENGRRLLSVLHPCDQDGNYVVWESAFAGCMMNLKPFEMTFDPNPRSLLLEEVNPVFVYQEKPL